jgi:hypothetical protein
MNNESLIASGLYGTWTFSTETMTDIGYYKGRAYVVMHLMADPMQIRSCQLKDCLEQSNHLCQRTRTSSKNASALPVLEEEEVCVDTESSIVEWSDGKLKSNGMKSNHSTRLKQLEKLVLLFFDLSTNFLSLSVTAFFQFGFQLRTGIAFKTYTFMNTSDWLGPYNLVMAPLPRSENLEVIRVAALGEAKATTTTTTAATTENTFGSSSVAKKYLQKFVSRYVITPSSSQLQYPPEATVLQPETFDRIVGMTAINQTIHVQQSLRPREDPYALYRETCVKGDIPAGILPRIQLGMLTTTTTITDDDDDDIPRMAISHDLLSLPSSTFRNVSSSSTTTEIAMLRVDFSLLSLPDPKSKLYNLWPTLQQHLGATFPLEGPYCYGNDPKRAYAMQLAYDSAFDGTANQTWKAVKGCLPDLPCWSDDGPAIPYDNGSTGQHILADLTGVTALVGYFLGFLLLISLGFNMQLSNQLKRIQQQQHQQQDNPRHHNTYNHTATPSGRHVPQQQVFEAFHDLEEPLLSGCGPNEGEDIVGGQEDGTNGGVEESKVEANP